MSRSCAKYATSASSQRRVAAQHGERRGDLRAQALGPDLADDERAEVEVLEAHDAPRAVARRRGPLGGEHGVPQRVARLGDRRDRPPDADRERRVGGGDGPERRRQVGVLVGLDEQRQGARPAGSRGAARPPPRGARRERGRRGRDRPRRRRRRATTTMRAGRAKSRPNAAARAASGVSPRSSAGASASSSSAPRTACSWARATSPRRASAASSGAPASAAGLTRRSRPRPARPATTSQPPVAPSGAGIAAATAGVPSAVANSTSPAGATGHARAQLVDGRPADDDLRRAVRADDDHGRVEEAPEALGHHALGLRAAQRVDEVALQRGQPPEDADLVARERALDVVDDVAERRLVRHREHREPVLAARLDERGRHALEDDALAEPEPAGARGGELAHEVALGARAPAQPHARREHHPLGLEEARRRLDLDDVRAGDRAARGGLLAAQQPQPVGALGEQVTERQPRSRAGGHERRPYPREP